MEVEFFMVDTIFSQGGRRGRKRRLSALRSKPPVVHEQKRIKLRKDDLLEQPEDSTDMLIDSNDREGKPSCYLLSE